MGRFGYRKTFGKLVKYQPKTPLSMCRPRPSLIKVRPTLTQETGRTKQLTNMMAFFHLGHRDQDISLTRTFLREKGNFRLTRHVIFAFEISYEAFLYVCSCILMRMRMLFNVQRVDIDVLTKLFVSLFSFGFCLKSAGVAVICEPSNGHT